MLNYKKIPGYFAEVFRVFSDDNTFHSSVFHSSVLRSPQFPTPNAAINYIQENIFIIAEVILNESKYTLAEKYIDGDEEIVPQVDKIKEWVSNRFTAENPIDVRYGGHICKSVAYVSEQEVITEEDEKIRSKAKDMLKVLKMLRNATNDDEFLKATKLANKLLDKFSSTS